MSDLRLGDTIDDYCIKCRRLTNHAIVSMMKSEVAKVRCRSCYHDHDYLREQIPPSKKDLKKAELLNALAAEAAPAAAETPEAAAAPVTPPAAEPEEVPVAAKKRSKAKKA